jgi:muramoyltetrapeptide carboxypeptidase LdcA involved in peptidoglycan recycling
MRPNERGKNAVLSENAAFDKSCKAARKIFEISCIVVAKTMRIGHNSRKQTSPHGNQAHRILPHD